MQHFNNIIAIDSGLKIHTWLTAITVCGGVLDMCYSHIYMGSMHGDEYMAEQTKLKGRHGYPALFLN